MGNDDKLEELKKNIQELFSFILKHEMNHTLPDVYIRMINRTLEHLKEYQKILEEGAKGVSAKHPAHKDRLNDEEILAKYKELKSFRAVGKALGCDAKTVKNRLEKMGYL